MKKMITTWVLLEQGIMFDGAFDSYDEAENKRNYYRQNYQGWWTIKGLTDREFKEMMGITSKIVTDMELSRAVGALLGHL